MFVPSVGGLVLLESTGLTGFPVVELLSSITVTAAKISFFSSSNGEMAALQASGACFGVASDSESVSVGTTMRSS